MKTTNTSTQDDFAELQAANKVLFENFLLALQEVAGGEPSQQRQEEGRLRSVTLQTGGKYYMVHASPAPTPCREDDPRRAAAEDNFYYPQEDFLAAQQAGKRWTWSVIRPTGIIGCTGELTSKLLLPPPPSPETGPPLGGGVGGGARPRGSSRVCGGRSDV